MVTMVRIALVLITLTFSASLFGALAGHVPWIAVAQVYVAGSVIQSTVSARPYGEHIPHAAIGWAVWPYFVVSGIFSGS